MPFVYQSNQSNRAHSHSQYLATTTTTDDRDRSITVYAQRAWRAIRSALICVALVPMLPLSMHSRHQHRRSAPVVPMMTELVAKTDSSFSSPLDTGSVSSPSSDFTVVPAHRARAAHRAHTASLSMIDMVHALAAEVSSTKDLARIRRFMESYNSTLGEWKHYAKWDPTKKYTRNLIATDNSTFTLMLVCWNPAKGSPVHNHAGSECFMRVIDGRIMETQYEHVDVPDSPRSYAPHGDITEGSPPASAPSSSPSAALAPCAGNSVDVPSSLPSSTRAFQPTRLRMRQQVISGPGDVNYVNDNIGLHKVENVFDQPAITLHLYVPPYQTCAIFDEASGEVQIGHVTLHSEYGVVHFPPSSRS